MRKIYIKPSIWYLRSIIYLDLMVLKNSTDSTSRWVKCGDGHEILMQFSFVLFGVCCWSKLAMIQRRGTISLSEIDRILRAEGWMQNSYVIQFITNWSLLFVERCMGHWFGWLNYVVLLKLELSKSYDNLSKGCYMGAWHHSNRHCVQSNNWTVLLKYLQSSSRTTIKTQQQIYRNFINELSIWLNWHYNRSATATS